VTAFSDALIRGIVHTGGYSDPAAEKHLADTLIARRDKIGAAYLDAVTPLVDFALTSGGELSFDNAAAAAGVAKPPSAGYQVEWATFDNATGMTSPIGESHAIGGHASAPSPLPSAPASFIRARISETGGVVGHKPIDVYFRRAASGWTLVGIDRGITTNSVLKEKTS
jgi:hypothetical protein